MSSDIEIFINNYDFECKLHNFFIMHGSETIVTEICKLLRTNDPIRYNLIITFARDFYIGSDLSNEEKDTYYKTLNRSIFFSILESMLNSEFLTICSSTIYNIGKLSHAENCHLLDDAYRRFYKGNDPVLSYRCLIELQWLECSNNNIYISELINSDDLIDNITLGLLYSHTGDMALNNTADFLTTEIQDIIDYKLNMQNKSDFIETWLWSFENVVQGLHSTLNLSRWNRLDFINFIHLYGSGKSALFSSSQSNIDFYKHIYNKFQSMDNGA